MSNKKRDYTKYSNHQAKEKKEEHVYVTEPADSEIKESVEESIEEQTVEKVEEPKTGVVIDCQRLNVRKEPSVSADIICEIAKQTEVMIYENESTNDFYKICTSAGIEGFCMKKYISVR